MRQTEISAPCGLAGGGGAPYCCWPGWRRPGGDFPADQTGAYDAAKAAIAEYPTTAQAPAARAGQANAASDWNVGHDPAGLRAGQISAPTLIADGGAA